MRPIMRVYTVNRQSEFAIFGDHLLAVVGFDCILFRSKLTQVRTISKTRRLHGSIEIISSYKRQTLKINGSVCWTSRTHTYARAHTHTGLHDVIIQQK
jgi:hypothetical protein